MTYREREAGQRAAMEYVRIYRLEPEAYQRSLADYQPGDLSILEGGNVMSENEHVTEDE